MHLFFECCVAKNIWRIIYDVLVQELGVCFESIARFWVANKRHMLTNIITSSVLWTLWKLRNEMYFQGLTWTGLRRVLFRIVKMVRGWIPLFKPETGLQVEEVAKQLEIRASLPPQLQWKVPEETSSLSESEPSSAQHSVSTNVASVLSDADLDVLMSIMFDVSDSGLRL
jgi:hypothetical protein